MIAPGRGPARQAQVRVEAHGAAGAQRVLARAHRELALGVADERVRAEEQPAARLDRPRPAPGRRPHGGLDALAVDREVRLAALVDGDEGDRRAEAVDELEPAQVDRLGGEPVPQPLAPRVAPGAAGEGDGAAVRAAGDRRVGDRAAEVRGEVVGGADRRGGALAHEVDDRLAETQQRSGHAGGSIVPPRARGRRPHRGHRRRADLLARAAGDADVPALYVHGVPNSSDSGSASSSAAAASRSTCPASGAAPSAATSTSRSPATTRSSSASSRTSASSACGS